jgi:hypothetical protein
MFNIEIEQLVTHIVVVVVNYVIFESMRINVNQIVVHIKDLERVMSSSKWTPKRRSSLRSRLMP